ncbi:hypothetical protein [Streptomyces sp. NPDC001492]
MSDGDSGGRTPPDDRGHRTHSRAIIWSALIGAIATVVGGVLAALITGVFQQDSSPVSAAVVSSEPRRDGPSTLRTPTTREPSSSAPATTPAPATTSSSAVSELIDLIASGRGSLYECTKYDTKVGTARAAVRCRSSAEGHPHWKSFVYSFASRSMLDAWMRSEVREMGTPDGDRCSAAGEWHGTWLYGGEVLGELTCRWRESKYRMAWSYHDQLVGVVSEDTDADLLYTWWSGRPLLF